MSKVIAIAFSDLHINLWSKFNESNKRTLNHFRVLFSIAKVCDKYDCHALFCGDMFHKPESIDQELHHIIENQFKELENKYPNFKCYAISGNHDIQKINRVDNRQLSWIDSFKSTWLIPIDWQTVKINNVYISGVPYIDHNIGISNYIKDNITRYKDKKNLLLLHTDYPGAKDTDNREIDSVENLNINTLNLFDLVLCGHIHKPQRLSKKVYMIGAPLQQRRTDSKCKLGYWELYDDLSMKFIELKGYPKFMDVEEGDEIKEDGNYYTILPKKTRVVVNNEHKITKQLSKKSLAKQYMKERGISDKNKKNLLINLLNKAESC